MFHPLSTFPDLLSFAVVAPTLLRLAVGVLGLYAAKDRFKKKYGWSAIAYAIASLLIILGLYTQLAALAGLLINSFDYYTDKQQGLVSKERKVVHILVKIILISLIFTGPGLFARDYPL